ncbi:MAG: MBL fold metallo-hydrolase, partial [Phycisphaerales bacterium]|nr:MBL fold metallo-hydrolase [Phycisphaerales bacterium]
FMRMIYDEKLAQAAYLIGCQQTGEAIIIDPERDVDRYIDLAAANNLRIIATAETHIHADFLSGSRELAERIGAKVYVSDEGDADWKYEWLNKKMSGGSYEHQLLKDSDRFSIGNISFRVLHTPGHTPEHIVFLITDQGSDADAPIGMASGDFVFVGDLGRPDLLETAAGKTGAMEPSARRLFQTLRKLDGIPDFVQVWPGHGAGSACGKALGAVPMSTIGYERRFNSAILAGENEQGFVDFILSGQPEPPMYFAAMKRDNKVGPRVLGTLPSPKHLNAQDARAIDAHHEVIIDTRPWEAFRAGHIPGSLSFPLDNGFNTNAGSMVTDADTITLVIEQSRIDEAVRDLVRIGLDRIVGWIDASELDAYEDSTHPLATIAEIEVTDAMDMLDDRSAFPLDVRRATEFGEGHIPGAVNFAHTRIASHLEDLDRSKRYIVNCRSGMRSARSCAFLQRNGFQVINLRGGFLAWELNAENPVR